MLARPDIKAKFGTLGVEPGKPFGKEFAAFVGAEMTKWADVVDRAQVPTQ